MLQYAITDRKAFSGSESDQRNALLRQAKRLKDTGVDYLQLREKDLSATDSLALALRLVTTLSSANGGMKVLLNGPAAIAQRARLDGLHVPSAALHESARFRAEILQALKLSLLLSVSCHTLEEVRQASVYADVLLFAPVFEKCVHGEIVRPGTGLHLLREACDAAAGVPVLALGGITRENTAACMDVGAAGVAGIRLFL